MRKYQKFKKIQKNFNRLILCQLTIRFPPSELEKYNFLLASSMSKNLDSEPLSERCSRLKLKKQVFVSRVMLLTKPSLKTLNMFLTTSEQGETKMV